MKKIRFNIIDLILLVAFICIALFVCGKVFGGSGQSGANGEEYIISAYCEEVPSFAAELIKKGDKVSDESKNIALGIAGEVILGDAAVYAPDENGKLKKTSKEDYNSVTLKICAIGEEFEHGIRIEGVRYSVGHSVVLYAGDAKISGRISEIRRK